MLHNNGLADIPINKIVFFQKQIKKWYYRHGRDFPWRVKTASNYKKVIAEILLQRTRAETVAGRINSFTNKYSSWRKLANANEAEIIELMKPLGLWRIKSTAIKELARVINNRNGRFPSKREELEKLPCVGQYIASSILLFCYSKPEPLLDVNMARVLERYFGPRKKVDIRYDKYLQEISRKVVNDDKAEIINWGILDLASIICRVNKPICIDCPVESKCLYKKQLI